MLVYGAVIYTYTDMIIYVWEICGKYVGNGDLVQKYLIFRRNHAGFNGENHFIMQSSEPEICLFKNACKGSIFSILNPVFLLPW